MNVHLAGLPQIRCDAVSDDDAAGVARLKSWVVDQLVPKIHETARVITLDGLCGAGKSTLGRLLADAIGAAFLDLDDYLDENKGAYYDHLDIEGCIGSLHGVLASDQRVVVSGILIEKVFAGFTTALRQKLYVVRTTSVVSNPDAGEWLRDPSLVDPQEEPDSYIAREKTQAQAFLDYEAAIEGSTREQGEIRTPVVDAELVRYHYQNRPLRHADLVVKVHDAGPT